MIDLNRLLLELGEDKSFNLVDGTKIRSLKQLSDKLKILDESIFKGYVNEQKNDFASWIKHCFEDELLAQRVSQLQTKEAIAEEIETRLTQARFSQIKNNLQETKAELPKTNLTPEVNTQLSLDSELSLDADLDIGQPIQQPLEQSPQQPLPEFKINEELSLDSNLSLDADLTLETKPEVPLAVIQPPTQKIESLTKTQLETLKPVDNSNNSLSPSISTPIIETKIEPMIKSKPAPAVELKSEPKLEPEKIIETPKIKPVQTSQTIVTTQIVSPIAQTEESVSTNTVREHVKGLFQKFKEQKEQRKQQKIQNTHNQELNEIQKIEQKIITPQTEQKPTNLRDLFKKLKDKKDSKKETKPENKQTTQTTSNTQTNTPTTTPNNIDDSPVDILNMSENDFYSLIGVNPEDQFSALTSKENLVKKKEKKYLKTGVPGFDELIDKGIPAGTAILLSGGPGSGKTTFAIQQLGFAAEHEERCLFISLEEKEERLIEHMKDYGLNPEKYLKNGNLKIKKLDSFKLSRSVEALLAQARGELMIDIDPVMEIIPDGYHPERIVVDSLSSIAAAFAGQPEVYRIYVEQLFNIFEKLGVTSFIITEIQGSETTGHGGVEDFLADGVVNFYNMKKGNNRQPAVEVFKMRGVKHKKKIVPFNFVSGQGIEIYPLEEVFHGD